MTLIRNNTKSSIITVIREDTTMSGTLVHLWQIQQYFEAIFQGIITELYQRQVLLRWCKGKLVGFTL